MPYFKANITFDNGKYRHMGLYRTAENFGAFVNSVISELNMERVEKLSFEEVKG